MAQRAALQVVVDLRFKDERTGSPGGRDNTAVRILPAVVEHVDRSVEELERGRLVGPDLASRSPLLSSATLRPAHGHDLRIGGGRRERKRRQRLVCDEGSFDECAAGRVRCRGSGCRQTVRGASPARRVAGCPASRTRYGSPPTEGDVSPRARAQSRSPFDR